MSACQICEKRRPRRTCPGVRGDICAPCCGEEREVSVDCPLDCSYLAEARRHEKLPDVNPDEFPNADIQIKEGFIDEHANLLILLGRALTESSMETLGATDFDVREALAAIVKTYRTRESGLIYETRPSNPYAAAVQQGLQTRIEDGARRLHEATGMHVVRDSEVLGLLVFLQRLEIQHNNGRRRGRAFLHFLLQHFPQQPEPLIGA